MITMVNDCYDDDDIVKKRKLSIVKEAHSTKKKRAKNKTKQRQSKNLMKNIKLTHFRNYP